MLAAAAAKQVAQAWHRSQDAQREQDFVARGLRSRNWPRDVKSPEDVGHLRMEVAQEKTVQILA
eukprot:4533277-Alexandrium_andersonii.AAC.1